MLVYDGDQHRYAQIAGHGFRILAEAMEKDLPYEIKCPSPVDMWSKGALPVHA